MHRQYPEGVGVFLNRSLSEADHRLGLSRRVDLAGADPVPEAILLHQVDEVVVGR